MNSKLNIYLEFFIYLVIIRHIIALFTAIIQILMTISELGSIIAIMWNIILNIVMIITLLYLLKVKRWALYFFGGIQLANIIFQWLVFDKDLVVLSIVAIILCVVMSLLLCIKKNGVSAWRMFFPIKDSTIINHKNIDHNILEDDILMTSDSSLSVKESKLDINEIKKNKTELEDHIASLPRMNDGSLNYTNMSNIQRFAYTYTTESPEIALRDLNSDILVKKKNIEKLKKEITLLTGAERIKSRDLLHEEIKLLNELYEIRNKYSKNKYRTWNNKKIASIILLIIFLLALGCVFHFKYTSLNTIKNKEILHKKSDISNKNEIDLILNSNTSNRNKIDKILALNISNRDKVYYILKSTGMIESKEDFFYEFDNNEKTRKNIYNRLRKKGYKDSEEEFYELMKPNKIYYDDYISKIYYGLIKAGYAQSVLGNEKQFSDRIAESNIRRNIYEYIKANNDFITDDFNAFEKKVLHALSRRWLYDRLSNEYNIGDYKSYNEKMDNEDKRKAIYKIAIKENLEVGSWAEFNEHFSE